ncbi:MAG: hypothetical protein BWY27_00755 [Bacteroidetes bacterium ADurb.Bin234]|jgi:hypothetical protein|nr:MAG: hypothetical protein BWY27_00755 [Bacteroidetes bacterium ADurb.Bin234]
MATRDEIKGNILAKMDEISPFSNIDVQWDTLIESLLNSSMNSFLTIIPIHLIKPVFHAYTSPTTFIHGTDAFHDLGILNLNDDFLRFSYATCIYWYRPARQLGFVTSRDYDRQFDIHTRAGVAKPKVFLDSINESNKRLIISPFRSNWIAQSDLKVYYVQKCETGAGLFQVEDVADELLEGYYWYAAHQVLTTMERPDFAQSAIQKYVEWSINKQ